MVSFTKSLYVGSETVNPNVTLTRSGDIFVAVDVVVHIISVPHPDALREFNNLTTMISGTLSLIGILRTIMIVLG